MSNETQVAKVDQNRIVVQDTGEFSSLLDTGRFEQLWRIAGVFSETQLVPAHFQKNRANCFLGLQMAFRLGVDPMMLMQSTYIVSGRPGMEAKMVIALINSSGLFEDPLDYEIEGDDAKDQKYRVRAVATRKGTGKVCQGPWIDWAMVKGEGWDSRSGSKWKSIPSQMFCYRAAAFFGRLYCPERLLGMQTAEELLDVTPVGQVETSPLKTAARAVMDRFTQKDEATTIVADITPNSAGPTGEIPITTEEIAEVSSDLLQILYSKITELAEKRGETADDMLSLLTKDKVSALIDLEGKPENYIRDLLLLTDSELTK